MSFELAVLNEPSVFKLLRFYCISSVSELSSAFSFILFCSLFSSPLLPFQSFFLLFFVMDDGSVF